MALTCFSRVMFLSHVNFLLFLFLLVFLFGQPPWWPIFGGFPVAAKLRRDIGRSKTSKVASFNLFLFFSAIGRDLRVRVSIGFDFWAILTK